MHWCKRYNHGSLLCYACGIVHTILPCIVPAPGEPWGASHALNIPVVLATCLATGVGAAAGIMGLKFALHGSGAELVHATPNSTFYYGSDASKAVWLESRKSDWFKAPFKATSAAGGDDDDEDDEDE